ncbi:MAG: amino acid permease [Ectothiorhodospiraceae bacterium]|nr:amino acid permease [Ectothiorhodospiraceae bacterium]
MAKQKLKKELRLFDVFAIAAGTSLSAGFFILPGLTASLAGEAMVLSFVIAAIPLVAAILAIVELGTAMPRAGGLYYFLDRTLGPMVGTIGGIGSWLILIFKIAFALIGMGAYLQVFYQHLPVTMIEVGIAIALGVIAIYGAKKSGALQIILVVVLLAVLGLFIGGGMPSLQMDRVNAIFDFDIDAVIATSGLIYISYGGLTKVVSLSEEIQNPERNLPLGMFLALGVTILVFVLGSIVMVGVLPIEELSGSLIPATLAAREFLGGWGAIVVTAAAIIAFLSVSNAGMMSASRFPVAMSRDHVIPRIFMKLTGNGAPIYSILITVVSIIAVLLLFDAAAIAKLAGAFQLLVFAMACLAVIIMRESHIDAYDPGYKSPLYPWVHWFGIGSSLYLINVLGMKAILFSSGLVILGVAWYYFYARKRVIRTGAIYHLFERLGKFRYEGLNAELRDILKEKGLRKDDPFHETIARSHVMNLKKAETFDEVVTDVAEWLSGFTELGAEDIKAKFMEGNRTGATPVTHNIILPHLRLEGIKRPVMVLVRAVDGMTVSINNPLTDGAMEEETVKAAFFLVSPLKDPAQHLRILAKIASRIEDDEFTADWENADTEEEIKRILTKEEGFIIFSVDKDGSTAAFHDVCLYDAEFPDGCLVAMIRRTDELVIPRGDTRLLHGDQVTVIGDPRSVEKFRKQYGL